MLIKSKLPAWLENVEDRTREKLRESVRKVLAVRAPRTPDELWHLIGYRLGMWIGRRPVCEDHDAPFDFVSGAFFEEHDRLLAMAAAGTGKTAAFAIIHELNGEYKAGTWTAHLGAVEIQARRCWDYLEAQLKQQQLIGKTVDPLLYEVAIDGSPLRSKIVWRNGSRLEVLAATLNQVSGPHPQVGAVDEMELIDWEVWTHFSLKLKEGKTHRAQMLVGSTRFKAAGPMQRLLNAKGDVFHVLRWCIYDAMARCSYDCHNVPGFGQCPLWSRREIAPDGSEHEVPMCHGRAHHADGHLTADEVINAYVLSDMDSWGSLMELRRPSTRGLFYPECDPGPEDLKLSGHGWMREGRHVSEKYDFDPTLPVYLGYDDGYTFPLCLAMWQVRPDGLVYQFDELYLTRTLPKQVIELIRNAPWLENVELGFPDPTARQAIAEFNEFFQDRLGRAVFIWDVDNDRLNGWRSLRRRLWDAQGHATIGWHPRCSSTYRDLSGLVRKEGTEDCEKVQDHGADQARYVVFNLEKLLKLRAGRDEERRPEGFMERQERQMAVEAEGRIRERSDRLRTAFAVPDDRLRVLEQRFGQDRVGLARALGEWLSEFTMGGRLRRAGLSSTATEDDEA